MYPIPISVARSVSICSCRLSIRSSRRSLLRAPGELVSEFIFNSRFFLSSIILIDIHNDSLPGGSLKSEKVTEVENGVVIQLSSELGQFALQYPLNDAPYTAVYEEQEVFCALHDYLQHAEGVDILTSVRLLLAEYIRYLVDRAVYYYPTMLPGQGLP